MHFGRWQSGPHWRYEGLREPCAGEEKELRTSPGAASEGREIQGPPGLDLWGAGHCGNSTPPTPSNSLQGRQGRRAGLREGEQLAPSQGKGGMRPGSSLCLCLSLPGHRAGTRLAQAPHRGPASSHPRACSACPGLCSLMRCSGSDGIWTSSSSRAASRGRGSPPPTDIPELLPSSSPGQRRPHGANGVKTTDQSPSPGPRHAGCTCSSGQASWASLPSSPVGGQRARCEESMLAHAGSQEVLLLV